MKPAANNQAYRTIAIFDFDGTLAAHDSLWPFLVAVAGRGRCYLAVLVGLISYLFPKGRDRRTVIKEILLYRILHGKKVADLSDAIERMKSWPRWLASLDNLKKHHEAGDYILIATGSLDLYVREMLGDVPYDAILSTEMECVDGILSGRMSKGNCVRKNKAQRIKEHLEMAGPFQNSWGYGNAPHDLPMMELVQNKVIV